MSPCMACMAGLATELALAKCRAGTSTHGTQQATQTARSRPDLTREDGGRNPSRGTHYSFFLQAPQHGTTAEDWLTLCLLAAARSMNWEFQPSVLRRQHTRRAAQRPPTAAICIALNFHVQVQALIHAN